MMAPMAAELYRNDLSNGAETREELARHLVRPYYPCLPQSSLSWLLP